MNDFEFDAGIKVDLLNDTDDMDADAYFSSYASSSANDKITELSTSSQPVSAIPKLKTSVRKSAEIPTPVVNNKYQNIRQSPRISEKKHLPIERPTRKHRRSLSEGINFAPKLNKISKSSSNNNDHSKGTVSSMKNASCTMSFNEEKTSDLKKIATITKGFNKPLKSTQVKEFKFSADNRVKSRRRSMSADETIKDFARSLRSCASRSNNLSGNKRGTTKIQAFKLHESKPKSTAEPFISRAERDIKYWKKTPQRFRSKPHNQEIEKKNKIESSVTIPRTPILSTRMRTRSIQDIPTREQAELKELEYARQNQFKAVPVDKKIFDLPSLMVETKSVTIPEPFDITDFKRESRRQLMKSTESCNDLSISSIPFNGIPTLLNHKKSTVTKPFSFHARDSETLKRKKNKILKTIEEEKKLAEFQAQPMPTFEGIQGLPKKKTPQKTKPQPFTMRTDDRGHTKQEQFRQEMDEQDKHDAEQRKFKAQSDAVLHKQAFIPEKSKKALTDISTFTLNTEKRYEDRQTYEIHLKQKEDEIMAHKREHADQEKIDEEEEIQKMRKDAVHKAQPVRKYTPVEVKHGLLKPTVPISPDFAVDSRLRSRAASRQNLNAISDG